ncbi:sensor histidine kinase [Actinoallomurus rhizosphaericola]|uniref:sensor histidine kinase n=1 Tax=Actinoallomurus rhizosphaericola TaxID=2952536 RepID=UPI0020930F49|nr:HAMP domain-containing sensor histidine kinase [Actinoallomurus rhizosphaericola]MCO5997536.1 HAMP domain-containing histidine kinase [Actinoallomurus rhizosphaericola]
MRTLPRPRVPAGLRPRTVRLRLTALYGVLFAVSGAILLAITYLLVRHATGPRRVIYRTGQVGPVTSGGGVFTKQPVPPDLQRLTSQLDAEVARQHAAQMHALLVQSGIALTIMVVVSVVLGWLVAGRVLRPLRTMTSTIRRISARNVHERLAVEGPRDELKDLGDTVDGLLGRLETALGAHKRFVANAAHELRTPLTLEHALLEETLTDRAATLADFRATSERVLAISEQQERLLEALLTLATGERGLDRRERFDLCELTGQALLGPRPQVDRLGLRIEARTLPAPAAGDPALAERLVANLLDNAVRYNVPGGRVEVGTATEAGRAVLSVRNTGPVIPPGRVADLFEPFQRLAGRTARDDGGHGLGLSIVRAIAAAHDATVTARARPEGGLDVEVRFP